MNDDGVIRLYYGTWYPFDELPKITRPIMRKVQAGMFGKTAAKIKAEKNRVMGEVTCVLSDDMLTVKEPPKHIISPKTKGTPFESRIYPFGKCGHQLYGHGFFEGSSIRKIHGKYYFIEFCITKLSSTTRELRLTVFTVFTATAKVTKTESGINKSTCRGVSCGVQFQILCKLQNVAQTEQNLCRAGAAQAAPALSIK